MGFVGNIVSAIVDIVVAVVELVIQIVEVIIEFIMSLLGYDESSQTIEYFEVHNMALFNDVDGLNPLLEVVKRSVISGQDIAAELIYAQTFQEYKGDIQDFMNYIEDGNYNEGFPTIESYITYPDITELTAALAVLNGVPCTTESSYTRSPTNIEWVEYWLQENKSYSYEAKTLPNAQVITYSTTAGSVSSSATAGGASPALTLTLTDEIVTSDDVVGTISSASIDLSTIVYNSGADDYSVDVFDSGGSYFTLTYNVPAKPTGLHYLSYYYIDSAPTVTYIFLYKVGTGTYPDLDDPQNEINIDATVLKAIPAIPLRLSNVDYTSRPATEVTKINELCDLVTLDAEGLLDVIKNDPDAPSAGDLDHIYVTFGVRLWDTSQVGMSYLFSFCENLFPAQGVTQGQYDGTASGDTKPANNIIITADDYKSLFQFNYISYEFTTLAAIDADSGSAENGYYYSDMSRFKDGILKYSYYVSSGKGTYNVGYKADTLTEVANFLSGSGTVNPGTTTTEATDWLQVTTRMSYNNTTPVLQDADGTVSELVFLTPDIVYKNNGAGVLRHVSQASEETTAGQSITYYRAIPSGLEAYTMKAPIASLRVEDGATGKFKMVKFNLGARDDLMVPFIHNFIAELSNKNVTQLFLAGAHASIYIAHYEVIVQRTGGFMGILMIIIIIIIIVVSIIYPPFATLLAELSPLVYTTVGGVATTTIAWGATIMNILVKLAINQIVKLAVTAVLGDSQAAQIIGSIAGMAAASGFGYGVDGFAVDFTHITEFSFEEFLSDWSWTDTFKVVLMSIDMGTGVLEYRQRNKIDNQLQDIEDERQREILGHREDLSWLSGEERRIQEIHEATFGGMINGQATASMLLDVSRRARTSGLYAEDVYAFYNNITGVIQIDAEYDQFYEQRTTSLV